MTTFKHVNGIKCATTFVNQQNTTFKKNDGILVCETTSTKSNDSCECLGPSHREVPMSRSTQQASAAYLGNDILELALFPGVGGVAHHGDDGVVVLLVLVVQEHQLCPQVGLLSRPQYLKQAERRKEVMKRSLEKVCGYGNFG